MHKKLLVTASLFLSFISVSACSPKTNTAETETVKVQNDEVELVGEISIGRSDFETMNLRNGAIALDMSTESPDLLKNGSRLSLPAGGSIEFKSLDRDVKTGDEYQGSIWLWKDNETLREDEVSKVAIQIVRWCSVTESEVKTENFIVTDKPTKFTLSHTFENDHDCALFKLVGVNSGTTVFAWDAALSRIKASE